ncbi:putative surface protein with fasciclin (FAS1) repeats [Dulcicalothrix desertica PCC 7102]|nr:putative surface protein with fasciclin (FAS1) repeats [Dulcicalothrix desertica PCC 7102]
MFKKTLLSTLLLGGAIALSGCGQPTTDNTTTPSAVETANPNISPVAEIPTVTATPTETVTVTASPTPTTGATGSQNLGQLAQAASSQGQFTILTKAVKAAGLEQNLGGQGPYTVFAPTDAAFNALPTGTVDNLLKPANKQKLVQLLGYHVVPGRVTSSQLKSGNVNTVEGQSLKVSVDTGVTVNGAKVVQADIPASNGVVHVVDKVLLPANFK